MVDETGVYWLDEGDHAVYRTDHEGEDKRMVYAHDGDKLYEFDIDDAYLFCSSCPASTL